MTKICLGSVGTDIHCVANQLIALELEFRGFKVFNFGVGSSIQDFQRFVEIHDPSLVLLGSTNGDIEPLIECVSLIKRMNPSRRIIVGGNFILGATGLDRSLDILNAGAERLISRAESVSAAVNLVESSLKSERRELISEL